MDINLSYLSDPEDEDFEDLDMDLNSSYDDNDEDDKDDLDGEIILDDEELLKSDVVISVDDDTDDSFDDIILSKHKMEGKHSLKYDSIFKGKKDDPIEDDDTSELFTGNTRDTIEVERSSSYYSESIDNESYIRSKQLKDRVYNILVDFTKINMHAPRRKPSKRDFNDYYALLKLHLKDESFTNVEIFTEVSVYFSDQLFNMFKLLDKKWKKLILDELQDHIGKTNSSKEIMNRNIYVDTEIEFMGYDDFGNEILITGNVTEVDYENSTFIVNSEIKLHTVHLTDITKISNNSKFKYNMNRLNSIDFL